MRRFLSTNASGTERKEIAIDPGDLTACVLIEEYGGGKERVLLILKFFDKCCDRLYELGINLSFF